MAEQQNPHAQQQRAEPKVPQHVAAKTGAKQEPAPAGDLAAAGETSDATVHQLLAERAVCVQNGDEDAIGRVDAALAELGYRA